MQKYLEESTGSEPSFNGFYRFHASSNQIDGQSIYGGQSPGGASNLNLLKGKTKVLPAGIVTMRIYVVGKWIEGVRGQGWGWTTTCSTSGKRLKFNHTSFFGLTVSKGFWSARLYACRSQLYSRLQVDKILYNLPLDRFSIVEGYMASLLALADPLTFRKSQ